MLPHGFEPPKEKLGYEEIIHTEKGMWSQRIYGMEYVFSQPSHSKYLLVCDDDIEFRPDFVEQLIKIADEYNADTLIPIKDKKAGIKQNILGHLTGGRTENKTSEYKISIKRNGRFSVNNHLQQNVNPTQSGPFQCFMMRTGITPLLNLRDEMWLDETKYAWPDDQVFFYKSHLAGLKNLSCKSPSFVHLDGKSGLTANQRRKEAIYGNSRNIIIFWRKFIYPKTNSLKEKLLCRWSLGYYLATQSLMMLLIGIKRRNLSEYRSHKKGVKDGKAIKI